MNQNYKKNTLRILCGTTLVFLAGFLFFKSQKTDISNTTVLDYVETEQYTALPPVYQEMMANKLIAAKENPQSLVDKPHFCWAPGTDPKVLEAFESFEANLINSLWYSLDKFRPLTWWQNTASANNIPQGSATTLTWSYPPDGTTIFSCNGEPNNPNNMIAFLNGIFGGPTTAGDFTTAPWHQIFVDMFEAWSDVSGLTFVYEPNDDGASVSFGNPGVLGTRGDHRITGHNIDGNNGILACNQFSDQGDMVIDTGDSFYQNNQGLGTFNVLAHEIGHGLGFAHVCPTSQTKLMEPFISTAFSGPQEDDILAVNRNYGDIDEPNDNVGAATNLGVIAVPSTLSRTTRSVDDNGDTDYYQFTTNAASDVTITMTPTGSTYTEAEQDAACNTGTNLNALTLANLQVELLASNGSTVLETGASQPAGVAESVFSSIAPGTYNIRIRQTGSTNNVQMYRFDVETIVVPVEIPVASFNFTPNSPVEFCEGFSSTINFNDNSSGVPTSWSWEFVGAGVSPITSTSPNPTVAVSSTGILTATLTASNSLGDSQPLSQTITVNELPASNAVCQASPCLSITENNFFLLNNITPSCATACTPVSRSTEVFSSQAYYLAGLTAGEEYTFDICDGYDSANWNAVLTIGTVNAGTIQANSEIAFAGGCSVTFTCPADGDYAAVVSEKDNCGGVQIQTSNGFPRLQCSGLMSTSLFTDPGGSTLNYFNSSNVVYTLCPSQAGQFVEVVFNSFSVEGDSDGGSPTDCYDILTVFNGNSTAAPQIGGEFCDSPGPGGPGTVTSTATDGCLTFEFTSDNFVTESGWTATVSCGEAAPPNCPGNYSLTGSETGTMAYATDGTIVSSQVITANAITDYNSGTDITLNPDFEVVLGAVFHAFIDGCPTTFTSNISNLQQANPTISISEYLKSGAHLERRTTK